MSKGDKGGEQEALEIRSVPMGKRSRCVVLMVALMVFSLLPPIVVLSDWPTHYLELAEWMLILSGAFCLSLVGLTVSLTILITEERSTAMGIWRFDDEGVKAFDPDGNTRTRIYWSEFENGRADNGVICIRGDKKVISLREWTIPRTEWRRATKWLKERFFIWEGGYLNQWGRIIVSTETPQGTWRRRGMVAIPYAMMVIGFGLGGTLQFAAAPYFVGIIISLFGILGLCNLPRFLRQANAERGRYLLDETGVTFERVNGESVRLAWNDIERIRIANGRLKVQGHGETIRLSGFSMTENEVGGMNEFAMSQLEEYFEVSKRPPRKIRILLYGVIVLLYACIFFGALILNRYGFVEFLASLVAVLTLAFAAFQYARPHVKISRGWIERKCTEEASEPSQ